MKKKVLFIISCLESGGVSKSLVNLLNVWDYKKYDTSLLVCSMRDDVFSKYVPNDIHFIYDKRIESLYLGINGIVPLILGGNLLLALGSMLRLLLSGFSKSLAGRWMAFIMPVVTKQSYDLIVDYNGQQQLYYMVDKLKSVKKVSFFHNDYSKWPYYYKADRYYYPKVDHIFSISQVCVDSLKLYFPDCADKISVMENIVSPEVIYKQAGEGVDELTEMLVKEGQKILLVTVAHFCKRKGSDLSIEVAKILKKRRIIFSWLFVGRILEPKLFDLASKDGLKVINLTDKHYPEKDILSADLIMEGVKSNPYPYMQIADIYVQPSRFEGKSISLDEAKILCKPIVVTNFSTVSDQFVNKVNASICQMTAVDIADKICELINDKMLRDSYINYLSNHLIDNTEEKSKLYQFL